jgi:hypothetical protein
LGLTIFGDLPIGRLFNITKQNDFSNDPIKALLYGAVSASFCVEGLSFADLAAATKEEASARLGTLRQRIELRLMSR